MLTPSWCWCAFWTDYN